MTYVTSTRANCRRSVKANLRLAFAFGLECVDHVHNIDHLPKPIRDASGQSSIKVIFHWIAFLARFLAKNPMYRCFLAAP
jgi:hypothetical protein